MPRDVGDDGRFRRSSLAAFCVLTDNGPLPPPGVIPVIPKSTGLSSLPSPKFHPQKGDQSPPSVTIAILFRVTTSPIAPQVSQGPKANGTSLFSFQRSAPLSKQFAWANQPNLQRFCCTKQQRNRPVLLLAQIAQVITPSKGWKPRPLPAGVSGANRIAAASAAQKK